MRLPAFLLILAILAGCNRRDETIAVYQAPKDAPPATAPIEATPASATLDTAPLAWTVPPSWKEQPVHEMRFATYRVSDSDPSVEMTVIALPPAAGALAPNVNRWETQLGLQPSPPDKLPTIVKHSTINGLEIDSVDLTAGQKRTLAAMLPHAGQIWFFKLTGPTEIVSAQKQNFDSLIASLHPTNIPSTAPAPNLARVQGSKIVSYTAPKGWTEIPNPTPPRMLTFKIPDADLAVTRFAPDNAGTFLDNINRWRNQLGLEPVADAQSVPMQEIKLAKDAPGVELDLENPQTKKRMLVVITSPPAGGDLWFFKLTGPTETVAAQKQNFDSFIRTVEIVPDANNR